MKKIFLIGALLTLSITSKAQFEPDMSGKISFMGIPLSNKEHLIQNLTKYGFHKSNTGSISVTYMNNEYTVQIFKHGVAITLLTSYEDNPSGDSIVSHRYGEILQNCPFGKFTKFSERIIQLYGEPDEVETKTFSTDRKVKFWNDLWEIKYTWKSDNKRFSLSESLTLNQINFRDYVWAIQVFIPF